MSHRWENENRGLLMCTSSLPIVSLEAAWEAAAAAAAAACCSSACDNAELNACKSLVLMQASALDDSSSEAVASSISE